jgi:hypothetical protein
MEDIARATRGKRCTMSGGVSRTITEEISMHVKALSSKRAPAAPQKQVKRVPRAGKKLTIRELGWTREHAREVRAKLATFAMDWDDPSMDVYNEP